MLFRSRRFDDDTVRALETVCNNAGNAQSNMSKLVGLETWVTDSEWVLRMLIPRAEIERLLHTTRYWRVVTEEETDETNALANTELDDARARWQTEMAELKLARERWAAGTSIVVADTNIFLHQPTMFDEIDWHATANLPELDNNIRFVIPITVVDEIDRLKDTANKPETKLRARQTLRKLVALFDGGRPEVRRAFPNGNTAGGGTTIEILADPPGFYVRRRRPDDEIVRRLTHIREIAATPITLITSDTGMRFRAQVADLRTIHLERPPDAPRIDGHKRQKGGRTPPTTATISAIDAGSGDAP